MPKRFSNSYKTFISWKKGRKLTKYAQKIIEIHQIFPKKSLTTLRKLKLADFSHKKWNKLFASQKSDRINALNVLSEVRKGRSLIKIVKDYGFSLEKVKQHLGNTISFKNNNWIARKIDRIERAIVIYENGKRKTIIVNNSSEAGKIGKYYNAVKKFLQTGNINELKNIKIKVKDSKGRIHTLETNPERILEIEEEKEEPELTEIYSEDE